MEAHNKIISNLYSKLKNGEENIDDLRAMIEEMEKLVLKDEAILRANEVFNKYEESQRNITTDIHDIQCKLSVIKANLQLEILRSPESLESAEKLNIFFKQFKELEETLKQPKTEDGLKTVFEKISTLSTEISNNTSISHVNIKKGDSSEAHAFKSMKDMLNQLRQGVCSDESSEQLHKARNLVLSVKLHINLRHQIYSAFVLTSLMPSLRSSLTFFINYAIS